MNDTKSEMLCVVVERDFPFPPEKVWRALTQPHLIEEWLMKNDFRPVVGHSFRLHVNPQPNLNFVIDCQVLEIEPNRRLSYTWNFDAGASGLNTTVTFTLTPTGTGTQLRMEQSGFPPDRPQNYRGATAGWQRYLANLETILVPMD